MFKALEMHRLLDRGVASAAWAAYGAYKGGARPTAAAPSLPRSFPAETPRSAPAAPAANGAAAAPTARPARPDVAKPLEDLL